MKYGKCTYVEGFTSGTGVAFHSSISGRDVAVSVDADTILKLAEVLKHTQHLGHACWHLNNPEAEIPCSGCAHKEAA